MKLFLLFGGATLVALFIWRARRGFSGPYRVQVWEKNRSTSEAMFESLQDARSYADDAASEEEEPIALVFDAGGKRIYEGRHYALRAMFK